MYTCDNCKQTTDPKTQAHRIIVETRRKIYPSRWVELRHKKYAYRDKGGEGHEIVREITVCPTCADTLSVHHVNSAAD